MKLLGPLLGATVVARTAAYKCPDYLYFNLTNAAYMADCARLNYACTNGSSISFDITGGAAPPVYCWKKELFSLYFEDTNFNGSIVLPDVFETYRITFEGGWPAPANVTAAEVEAFRNKTTIDEADILNLTGVTSPLLLNISSIDFPDLVNISDLSIRYSGNLSSLTMPKLENINGRLYLDLSHGPAISLSFPKLSQVKSDMYLGGKIDALEFPALNSSRHINVATTGDLDCLAFAKSVVNTTKWPVENEGPENRNSSVVCNSNTASVTMHPMPPPPEESTGSRDGLDFCRSLILLAILVAGASSVV